MSNIYIQEPPTNGKVCLKTSVGDIEIELWSKECPKACRNFLQLSMERYYDGTIFHRVVPGFIVQGGDPTGTAYGGESCYGQPFKDEFHSRLRFVRRGLVAMANGGKPNDNESQFFFTLDKTPELQNKHTIFGQVVGPTLFNMLKLGECEVDKNERPENPQKILNIEIISNPFPDIKPRVLVQKHKLYTEKESKQSVKGTKNYNLLSFGDEAEEDEELYNNINKTIASKGKSTFEKESSKFNQESHSQEECDSGNEQETSDTVSNTLSRIKEKLKRNKKERVKVETDDNIDMERLISDEKDQETKAKLDALKNEYKELKSELRKTADADKVQPSGVAKSINPDVQRYIEERERYKAHEVVPRKSAKREEEVKNALEKFREKLQTVRQNALVMKKDDADKQQITAEIKMSIADEDEIDESDWLPNVFSVPSDTKDAQLLKEAKDANVKDEERYDIFDPRNALNKRRRQHKNLDEKESKRKR